MCVSEEGSIFCVHVHNVYIYICISTNIKSYLRDDTYCCCYYHNTLSYFFNTFSAENQLKTCRDASRSIQDGKKQHVHQSAVSLRK